MDVPSSSFDGLETAAVVLVSLCASLSATCASARTAATTSTAISHSLQRWILLVHCLSRCYSISLRTCLQNALAAAPI